MIPTRERKSSGALPWLLADFAHIFGNFIEDIRDGIALSFLGERAGLAVLLVRIRPVAEKELASSRKVLLRGQFADRT
jgi:hypothetical protein